jgi:formylglycine-generating enzyme required for sulfatase activity
LRRSSEEGITVIPVLVMGAEIPKMDELPESMRQLLAKQVINLRNYPDFSKDFDELIRDIRRSRGFAEGDMTFEKFEPETIYIAEGPFLMGSPPAEGISDYETPQFEVILPDYRIGKYPVTNAEYEVFISQQKQKKLVPQSMGWDGQRAPKGKGNCPVTGVTWFDALDYCKWLSEKTEHSYSLPNEAQWEKACRGGNNSFYPWGDEFDPTRCNHGRSAITPVKEYIPQNDFGCHDLVGNVLQWTCTLWGEKLVKPDPQYEYPWEDDQRNDLYAHGQIRRVMRGSSFHDDIMRLHCSARNGQLPTDAGSITKGYGFRVVMLIQHD